ncbi:MAG: YafY family transcriptional regulator [Chitinophagia bacterium]|nr:YafY family transcriptional regulator [Chitinophagia bacterium]
MNRIDRLLGILLLLQSKKYTTAERIADKYEISLRTVYRDLKALGEQGVPVGFEPGKGYFIVRDYFLPPVSFSTEEARALLLMETLTAAFADRGVGQLYSQALDKVRHVLQPGQREALEKLSEGMRMKVPDCVVNQAQFIPVLQEAITNRTIVQLHYKNNKEEISTREIEPIGLVFYSMFWHLIGWCHLRKDYRDFRILRIIDAANTGKPFTHTSHMPLDEYMKLLPINY